MKLKGIELKPGMVLSLHNGCVPDIWVIIPTTSGLAALSFNKVAWKNLPNDDIEKRIKEIHKCSTCEGLLKGELLWSSDFEVSMRDIANKFGIPINKLRIKK